MGKFLRELLEQDAPIGAGQPAGDTTVCFDPNTGEQIPCPPAGATNPAGDQPFLGGAPQNKDHGPVPESRLAEEGDECEPDEDGACPEGYEKTDDGKCRRVGGTEESLLGEGPPPWADDDDEDDDEDDDAHGGDDDDEDDYGGDDDEDDEDEEDESSKKESLGYHSVIANMVRQVMEGGKAREVVRRAFWS